MNVLPLSAVVATVCLASSIAYAQNAALVRDADLKLKPFTDAPTVSSLAKKSPVTIVDNQGGWTQVRDASGQTGWVRLLNVRPDSQSSPSGGLLDSLSSLGNVARTGATGATATTGTKGISNDLLARAVPNAKERKRMDQYRASQKSAKAYARSNKLHSQAVAWLESGDAPPAPTVGGTVSGK